MLKRAFLLLPVVLVVLVSNAQINVLFQPGVNGNTVAGLVKVQFVNAYSSPQAGSLLAVVKLDGRDILKMRTPSFTIPTGNSSLPPSAAQGISFQYADNPVAAVVRQSGIFPDGEYEYCFTFEGIKYNNSSDEFCFPNTIQNSTPVVLINPIDGDQLCDTRPSFSWQPPIPIQPGTRFKIQLAELLKDENPAAALLRKNPVFQQDNLTTTIFPFPNNIPALKEGRRYVWQVIAYSPVSLSRTEIWEFSIQCNDALPDSAFFSYRELKQVETGDFYLAVEVLRIYFNNPYNAGILNYQIVNVDKPNQPVKGLPKLQVKQGMNYFNIPLLGNRFFREGNQYRLKVTLADGQALTLTFNYQTNNK